MIRTDYWWVYKRPQGLYWAHCQAPGGAPIKSGECSGWGTLPVPKHAHLVVCVPGATVRVYDVQLPRRNRRRFLGALPYALEERLLREPEAYHFVRLPRRFHDPRIAVAVAEHETITSWLQEAEEFGYRIEYLIPDYLMVPAPPADIWMLDVSAAPLLLRQSQGRGGATFPGQLTRTIPGPLVLALETAENRPRVLRVRVASDAQRETVESWGSTLAEDGIEVEVIEDKRPRSGWLASRPLPHDTCNMLRGPYATAHNDQARVGRGIRVTGLALALACVLTVGFILDLNTLKHERAALQAAIQETYLQAFPDSRHVVDARFQMAQNLDRLRERHTQSPASRTLLEWLVLISAHLNTETAVTLDAFILDGDALKLDVTARDRAAISVLTGRLGKVGAVSFEESTNTGDDISGVLTIVHRA